MEELVQVTFEEPSVVKLSNSGIRVIKNRTLLAPGFWNGRNYFPEEITKAFNNTNWDDKDVISLVADHRDDDSKGRPLTIRDWLGFVSNIRLEENGFLKGDLNLCDSDLSLRLIDGKAPFGISPFVQGKHDKLTNSQRDFIFKNFAVVVEPACKESYINEYLEDDGLSEKLEDVSAFERIRKRMGMSVSGFYAVPRDPPSSSKLPIFDKSHTQNAMSRFNQTQFSSEEEKSKARNKIMSKAKQFGIEVKEFSKLQSHSSEEDVQNIELKGGNKMTKEKLNDEVEQVEQVEEVKEPVNESPEESSEEVEETKEETEDEIVEKMANLTEKLMNKRKLTPEMAKMQKLENEITSLRNEIRKLSESKVEKKVTTEKLSAKPKSVMTSVPKEDKEFKGLFKKGASQGTMDAFHKLSEMGIVR
ncbi:MAG: hypothetical protein ACFFG0_03050 [Candidatus Thorarchaeota archaeon]